MAKAHSTESLSEQVITYLSDYCKTEILSIEYHPQLYSFNLYFKIESLVGATFKDDFYIHVQRPTMNAELYDVIIPLINMIHSEVTEEDDGFIDISFANKRKFSKAVGEYITNNNIGTLAGIFKQFPGLTFATRYTTIERLASTVVSLGYRKFTGNINSCYLSSKMVEWLKEYPIFEVVFDVNRPMKMSRVVFMALDGFKDFFQFKYLAELVKLSELTDFKPKTTDTNAMTFDL